MAIVFLCAAMTVAAQGQTYQVIYNFSGGHDGSTPFTGLAIDAGGTLYGTTFAGGASGYGTIFSLAGSGSGWTLNPLYQFAGGSDGAGPVARLVKGPDGALYGSTSAGGGGACTNPNGYRGCGTVYELRPPAHAPKSAISSWGSSIIYRFSGSDGAYPQGDLTFDAAGNIYGTAINGGSSGWGSIYSLTNSGGGWSGHVLYQVTGHGDGQYPWGGVALDQSGNLYGVLSQGGTNGYGAVYKLTHSGSGWAESTVHAFTFRGNDGAAPQGGLMFDQAGNLYGTTVHNATGGGTVFALTPSGSSFVYDFMYSFTDGIDLGPYDKLVMDASGNVYGTTFADGRYGFGSVFKLTHGLGGWTYTSLHDFTGGSDGSNPMCSLVFDADGNLYGTASGGGSGHKGVVFQIRP
jgi:uncharacterized repeat protein (TIGR03803 family)